MQRQLRIRANFVGAKEEPRNEQPHATPPGTPPSTGRGHRPETRVNEPCPCMWMAVFCRKCGAGHRCVRCMAAPVQLPHACSSHAGCTQAPACVEHLHAQTWPQGSHPILARRLRAHLVLACQRFHGRMSLRNWLAWRLFCGVYRSNRTGHGNAFCCSEYTAGLASCAVAVGCEMRLKTH